MMNVVPPGMMNRGRNICFNNSALQCLFRCPDTQYLVEFVEKSPLILCDEERNFLTAFIKLMTACAIRREFSQECNENFIKQCELMIPDLYNTNQQDAAEALTRITL